MAGGVLIVARFVALTQVVPSGRPAAGLLRLSAVGCIVTQTFTVSAVIGITRAALAPVWVTVLGWISAAAHVVVLFALGDTGPFALDGPVGMFVPVTTDLWLLTMCANLPGRVKRRA